jgi:predicted ribosomally synthesized peptide with SipW-like signal peptide
MKHRRSIRKRRLLLLSAGLLLLSLTAGGTLAWLTDKDQASNIFTVGMVGIALEETTGDRYQMLPGCSVSKDPKVTVKSGSEKCWLFIRLQEENDLDRYLTYTLADGWLPLPEEADVYYRPVEQAKENQTFSVLKDDLLYVPDSVTRQMLDSLTEATYPRLTVHAKAVQYYSADGIPFDPADAWAAQS